VEGYIKAGIDAGAQIAPGSWRPPIRKGWYVEPTVFTHADNALSSTLIRGQREASR
jgi:acyl-CoA reductase-like NAD-dependent aldehyde dehydrogenase